MAGEDRPILVGGVGGCSKRRHRVLPVRGEVGDNKGVLTKDNHKGVASIEEVCLLDDVFDRNGVYYLKGGQVHNLNGVVVVGLYYYQFFVIAEGDFVCGIGWWSHGGNPM